MLCRWYRRHWFRVTLRHRRRERRIQRLEWEIAELQAVYLTVGADYRLARRTMKEMMAKKLDLMLTRMER